MLAPVAAPCCMAILVHGCSLAGCSQPCGGGAALCVPVGGGPECRGEPRCPRKMRLRQGSWSVTGRWPPQSQVAFYPSSLGHSSGLLSLSSNWQQCPYHQPRPHHRSSQAPCPSCPHLRASPPLTLTLHLDSPQTLPGSRPSHNPDLHCIAWMTTEPLLVRPHRSQRCPILDSPSSDTRRLLRSRSLLGLVLVPRACFVCGRTQHCHSLCARVVPGSSQRWLSVPVPPPEGGDSWCTVPLAALSSWTVSSGKRCNCLLIAKLGV